MESHPSYSVLSALIARYPRNSGSLFQAYNDIIYAQQWNDVELIDLANCARGAIKGKKRDSVETLYIIPCSLSETLNIAWLQSAFSQLSQPPLPKNPSVDIDTSSQEVSKNPFLYLAITSSDASIVYYKLSQGIVKPKI